MGNTTPTSTARGRSRRPPTPPPLSSTIVTIISAHIHAPGVYSSFLHWDKKSTSIWCRLWHHVALNVCCVYIRPSACGPTISHPRCLMKRKIYTRNVHSTKTLMGFFNESTYIKVSPQIVFRWTYVLFVVFHPTCRTVAYRCRGDNQSGCSSLLRSVTSLIACTERAVIRGSSQVGWSKRLLVWGWMDGSGILYYE